ncbi:hypothetical protein DFS34DRAFT_655128 [Phlyctochytrium arcticum]|nr:hypothetical protein DFS34DRAFT_655128 [Phlyctochytrium arcticum]
MVNIRSVILAACAVLSVSAKSPFLGETTDLSEAECAPAPATCQTDLDLATDGKVKYPSAAFDTAFTEYAQCMCHVWSRCSSLRHQWLSQVEKKVMRSCQFGAYNNALLITKEIALPVSVTAEGTKKDKYTLLPLPLKNAQNQIASGNATEPLFTAEDKVVSAGESVRPIMYATGLVAGAAALWL